MAPEAEVTVAAASHWTEIAAGRFAAAAPGVLHGEHQAERDE
jgi:hypothetical protein